MKKLLALTFAIAMTISLTACGGEEAAAPQETPEQDVVEVPADQAADEQAKADQDFAQLQTFMQGVTDNFAMQQEVSGIVEQVKTGELQESDLLEAYKNMAEHSQTMLTNIQNAEWVTSYYDDKITALTACVEALVLYEQTVYEGGAENDASILEKIPELYSDYDEKLGTFLDLMGVE